jgi:hypothetical protein
MYSIRHLVTIQAPQRQIYQQLLRADFLTYARILPHENDSLKLIFNDALHIQLNINELIANKCLVLNTPQGNAEWEGTEVAFDLSEISPQVTIIRLSHSNWLRQTDLFAETSFRWAQLIDKFRIRCEQKIQLEVSIL